ncbi:glomulin-like [Saccostrea echinata]|uniref:glomulin-like n=1 Tax=Saccostrea echinata TaxID=191078 RepID=UPI002A7F65FC|nr:glomulin-like [Saccostrea echinata]
MEHLMDMEIMEKATDAETALKQIKECIQYKDSKGLKTVILEHKLKDQSVFWEIASELTANLTEENLEASEYFFETCQRCLNYIIENGNPKELLLAILEQADSFKDDQKFKCIMESVQKILLKLPSKRHHSLDITLETLSAHIEALPEPKDHNLDKEERKLLEMDSSVMRATDVVLCYLEFLSPFVEEVSMKNPQVSFCKTSPQVQLLMKHLMKLLSHPLFHLDMTFRPKEQEEKEKSYSRICAERLIDHLSQLCPNFFALIEQEMEKRSWRTKQKTSEENDEEMEEDSSDKVRDWKEDKLIPEKSFACLAYLVIAEGLGADNMPCVYSHKFMLRFHLTFIKLFLEDQHSLVKLKGVLLLEKLIAVIPPFTFKHYELDNDYYKDILNSLISTMTHCQNKDIRIACVPIYSTFFSMFTLRGRFRLYEIVFNTCKFSGVVGYTLSLYKEQVDTLLKQGEKCENLFFGENMIKIFKLVSVIPDGATTDLLESSDRILSVLNFIRYLVLRDNPASNATGFWDLYPRLDKEFFEPLRQAIILSKGHYNLDLEDVKKGNPLPSEETEFKVNVGGETLGAVSKEQRIQVIESALNTFDMMDSILSRIIELADGQKRMLKENQADS